MRYAPLFITPEGDHLELARDLIGIFGDHTGKKLGELNDILEEMEEQGFDYRLVRGLVSLLERRCDLRVDSAVEPAAARRAVFAAAARVLSCRHCGRAGIRHSAKLRLP